MNESPHPNSDPTSADRRDEGPAHVPSFEPVVVRRRADGWTRERQIRFIRALAESACVADACKAVGMSERSAYGLRARADATSFNEAWDAAVELGIRRLSDAVVSRAIHGVVTPVFYRGEQVGEKRKYDERLAVFLLQRRDPLFYGRWRDTCDWKGDPHGAAHVLAGALAGIAPNPLAGEDSEGNVS